MVQHNFTDGMALGSAFLLHGSTLTLGQDSGHSSLIQGFTAGGFIYISVAGVLAEMNNSGRTTLVNTVIQLISLRGETVVISPSRDENSLWAFTIYDTSSQTKHMPPSSDAINFLTTFLIVDALTTSSRFPQSLTSRPIFNISVTKKPFIG
ncbi:hypothetical protein H5410_019791 [Solanum commersonii]|uniref:Uncharacterized protein n=1 Tax=Solanum commersonii TaxID=4109 RepID=A0A9J5ZC91_SOLCO|nr:hypothetical protein H5410_019791 [Solanum commersonii]